VVTNFHVVGNMAAPRATFLLKDPSGREIRSSHDLVLVGGDPLSDIAVLQAPSLRGTEVQKLISPLQRGSSSGLVPGQEVFALGNPYGLEHSMSLGVISGVSRTMRLGMGGRPMDGVIQTDAAINPGNSGGPLLDSEGKVVGMNSAIMSAGGSFSGVGLAIPIDLVQHHVGNMMASGYVSRAALGVTFAPSGMQQVLGIDGAIVMKVVPEGPASKAGVRALSKGRLGDVIVGINYKRVSSSDDIVKVLDELAPGRKITVQLKRASQDLDSDKYDFVDLSVELASSGALHYPMIAV
jgi:S1-C subfamily serine protease